MDSESERPSRCFEHDLAVGPDGRCALCRRAAIALEAPPASASSSRLLLSAIGVGVALCIAGGIAHAMRGAPTVTEAAAEAPVVAAAPPPNDEAPSAEAPRGAQGSALETTRAATPSPDPPTKLPQPEATPKPVNPSSQLDDALASARRLEAETAPAPNDTLTQTSQSPRTNDPRQPRRYYGGVGAGARRSSCGGAPQVGPVVGTIPGASMPAR